MEGVTCSLVDKVPYLGVAGTTRRSTGSLDRGNEKVSARCDGNSPWLGVFPLSGHNCFPALQRADPNGTTGWAHIPRPLTPLEFLM